MGISSLLELKTAGVGGRGQLNLCPHADPRKDPRKPSDAFIQAERAAAKAYVGYGPDPEIEKILDGYKGGNKLPSRDNIRKDVQAFLSAARSGMAAQMFTGVSIRR